MDQTGLEGKSKMVPTRGIEPLLKNSSNRNSFKLLILNVFSDYSDWWEELKLAVTVTKTVTTLYKKLHLEVDC